LRDAFAVLFFVSVGMLLDPWSLFDSPALIGGALAIVLIGKPLSALLITWLSRYPLKGGLMVAVALGQIGEFSFILSTLGQEIGLLPKEAANVLVAVSIISIVLNPIAYRSIEPLSAALTKRPRLMRWLERSAPIETATGERPRVDRAHRAVLVGYGPTGRTVARLLKDNGVAPTIVEMNMDTVRALRDEGFDAVYGDATRSETLREAGVEAVANLILTSAGMSSSAEVIRVARELNPGIRVLARASYLRDLPELERAGADTVYTGEGEVGLAFVEDLLSRLGATAEQIDRQRARAHKELFGNRVT
jgi:CPA2 family monovalent cation:H+ antiporter-2